MTGKPLGSGFRWVKITRGGCCRARTRPSLGAPQDLRLDRLRWGVGAPGRGLSVPEVFPSPRIKKRKEKKKPPHPRIATGGKLRPSAPQIAEGRWRILFWMAHSCLIFWCFERLPTNQPNNQTAKQPISSQQTNKSSNQPFNRPSKKRQTKKQGAKLRSSVIGSLLRRCWPGMLHCYSLGSRGRPVIGDTMGLGNLQAIEGNCPLQGNTDRKPRAILE